MRPVVLALLCGLCSVANATIIVAVDPDESVFHAEANLTNGFGFEVLRDSFATFCPSGIYTTTDPVYMYGFGPAHNYTGGLQSPPSAPPAAPQLVYALLVPGQFGQAAGSALSLSAYHAFIQYDVVLFKQLPSPLSLVSTAVPEPTTFLLAAVACLCLLLYAHRKPRPENLASDGALNS